MVPKRIDHPNRKLDVNLTKAVDALNALKELNVSFVLAVHMGGKTRSFGTNNSQEVFDNNREDFE